MQKLRPVSADDGSDERMERRSAVLIVREEGESGAWAGGSDKDDEDVTGEAEVAVVGDGAALAGCEEGDNSANDEAAPGTDEEDDEEESGVDEGTDDDEDDTNGAAEGEVEEDEEGDEDDDDDWEDDEDDDAVDDADDGGEDAPAPNICISSCWFKPNACSPATSVLSRPTSSTTVGLLTSSFKRRT